MQVTTTLVLLETLTKGKEENAGSNVACTARMMMPVHTTRTNIVINATSIFQAAPNQKFGFSRANSAIESHRSSHDHGDAEADAR
ncbi:hypothetical protein V6N12_043840 [Hibiscus sabdariffa]|uniref:Uncharacterized protein n=1 Tax=Hibiscus sabdariffa TaxID=183260 RepID=A0ABR2DFJ3_9ROSI